MIVLLALGAILTGSLSRTWLWPLLLPFWAGFAYLAYLSILSGSPPPP